MHNTAVRWNSKISFIFAASAAAIGLGNIWRFPYMVGQQGGSAFVLLYLAFVVLLGIPLLIAEITLGRMGRSNPVESLQRLAHASKRHTGWRWLGLMNILASFLIVTYYTVIVGWVLDYLWRALSGQFYHISEIMSTLAFQKLQSHPLRMIASDTIVVGSAMGIIIFGIKQGLERAVMTMFPALLLLLALLLGYAMTTGFFDDAIVFMFQPHFEKIGTQTILLALGQAFFSLNIAMGITIMFSAYLPDDTPIVSSAVSIAIADTVFALLAGLIIFPIVFANQLKPGAGPSLIFKTLPIAFGQMPFGSVIASLFFLLLFFAAFTSVIALLEPAVAWLIERFHMSRVRAVLYSGLLCWILSLGSLFSFSTGTHITFMGLTFYGWIDRLTADIMLPIGGLLLAIFSSWLLKKTLFHTHLHWDIHGGWFKVWNAILRYFAPVAILFILLTAFKIL